jgi:hypothetical protein
MDAQAMRDMLTTDLLFVVLPVVLGFTFNVVVLLVIINADLIWQRIASARRADQPREANAQPATRPRLNSGGLGDGVN